MIEAGQHIKCILQGGVLIEGIVESFSVEMVVLNSLSDQSRLIIPNALRDIMLIKVIVPLEKKTNYIPQKIDQDIEEIRKEPMSDLKNKKLAELQILKLKAEKEIIVNRLKEHRVSEVRTVQYGTPGFFSKQSSK